MSDVLTRVPLYARIPGGARGHVSRAPVQTADILETMLDLAGINTSFVRFATSLRPQAGGLLLRGPGRPRRRDCAVPLPRS
jgi:choline-sulfatase